MRFNNAAIAAAGLVGILGVAAIATTNGAGAAASEPTASPSPATTLVLPTTTPAPVTTAAPTTAVPTTTPAPTTTTAAPVPTTEAPTTTAAPVEAPTTTEAPAAEPAPVEEAAPAAEAGPAAEQPTYAPTSSVAGDTGAEYEFLDDTNATRASIGVAPLTMNNALVAYARNQAQAMADAGTIYHSDITTLLSNWSTVGENVGVGPAVLPIHNALVASPLHYRNLADTAFTNIGIGVVHGTDGRIYTAHVFGA